MEILRHHSCKCLLHKDEEKKEEEKTGYGDENVPELSAVGTLQQSRLMISSLREVSSEEREQSLYNSNLPT